jgi:iron complex transport system substrate-binding protein
MSHLPKSRFIYALILLIFFLPGILLGCNKKVQNNKPPEIKRIVSLSPNVTEILFAIGAGNLIVGVTSFDDYPPQVKDIPKVGGVLDPDYEAIISLAPDVVIVLRSQQQLATELYEVGLNPFVVPNDTLSDVYDSITSLGQLLGLEDDAEQLKNSMQNRMANITDKVKDLDKKSVAFVFEHGQGALQDIYVAGNENFVNDLINMAGGFNVFGDLGIGYPQVNFETFIKRNPEVIFDCTEAGGNPYEQFTQLKAVRNNQVFFCFDDFIQKPGPRLVQSLEYLARHLHPEAFEAK